MKNLRAGFSYGRSVGDRFLTEVSRFMSSCIDERDMLGRLCGDEFALIIQRKLKGSEFYRYVNTLQDRLSGTIALDDLEIIQGFLWGRPLNEQETDALLKQFFYSN